MKYWKADFFKPFLLPLLGASIITLSSGCYPAKESTPRDPAHEGTGERVGEYLDDSVITTKVKAALIDDPELSAIEVNVETYKGVVQLSGFVRDPEDIARATQVVRQIKGVNDVKNDLRLKTSVE